MAASVHYHTQMAPVIEIVLKWPGQQSRQDPPEEVGTKRCLFCGALIGPEDVETFQKTGRCLRCHANVND
jgi:hypothetical protein